MPYNMKKEGMYYDDGGSLKAIPSENKGLPKLPKDVRNKMGYMQEGAEYIDDREYVMRNGGVTNFDLAKKGMGGSLNPVTSTRSGKSVPGMYNNNKN